jgi:hypothetical protein
MEDTSESRRERAIKRIKERNAFWMHLVVYAAINGILVVIWAINDAGGPRGFWPTFWPIYPLLGWGFALAMHAYAAFWARPITEEQIEREMRKMT